MELPDQVVRNLAWAVAAEIRYAFAVDWDPEWVKPGGAHSWHEDAGWFARCGACLQDSPAFAGQGEAIEWALSHENLERMGPS